MICNACGAEMAEGSVFSPKCGQRLEGDDLPGAADSPAKGSNTVTERFKDAARERSAAGDEQEEELWEGSYSAKAMIGSWLLGAIGTIAAGVGCIMFIPGVGILVFLVIAALIWIGLGGLYLYRRWSVHYKLTSQRFIHKEGILRQVTDRIEVIDMDDVALMTYTSGTTGLPKGAMLTYGNALFKSAAAAECSGVQADDVLLAVAPLYHIAGMVAGVLMHSGRGGGLSDMFGGAGTTALGSTAAERNLTRITTVLAIVWIGTVVALSFLLVD